MNISVQQKTGEKLVFYLNQTTHTLCNILKDELWNDKNVTAAAYSIDHPLTGQPKFIIETKGKAPEKALADAVARLQKKNKEFSDLFAKAK
jgi:DNA-directed RNA polymerase subunit L